MTDADLQQKLDQAERLLAEKPRAGEAIPHIEYRRVRAQWLIAEVELELAQRRLTQLQLPSLLQLPDGRTP